MSTEEAKAAHAALYGFNPLSRRWVKRSSDTWLRLIKSGLVKEDPERLEELTSTRREAARKRIDDLSRAKAERLVAEAAQRGMAMRREEPPVEAKKRAPSGQRRPPSKLVLAALRQRLSSLVKGHGLASSCSSVDELAERLSALAAMDPEESDEDASEDDHSE